MPACALLRSLRVSLLFLSGLPLVAWASPLEGIWKFEQRSFIAKAVLYSTFEPDGSCTQVARGRALGMTQWVVNTCTWLVKDDLLSMEMLTSTQDGAAGSTARFEIVGVSEEQLVLSVDDEQQVWLRVREIPEKFAQRITKELQD